MNKLKLSVVVPCYNEQEGISELWKRVTEVCRNTVGMDYELILVNDGSTDNTWSLMREISNEDVCVVAINLSRNYGHQLALSAGLKFSKGNRVFILDADLQDPPELLSKMMDMMDEGCDVVFGQRNKREGENSFKKISAYSFYRILNWFTDITIPKDTGDFRLISRRVTDELNNMPEQYRFIRGMVSWMGLRQEAIVYDRNTRFAGQTKYPISKMIKLSIDAITGFSVKPLRFASWFGALIGIITIFLLFYVLFQYWIGSTIQGWASLALIVLAIGSIQLMLIGILGEYLGRIYMESKGRPLFIVQEIVNKSVDHYGKNNK